MLESHIEEKLEGLSDIPTIPAYLSRLMRALDNTDIPAKKIAELVERDQALTTKVLKSANSAHYGQQKKVSTVELAIILMGLNTIKEIVVGMLIKRFFANIPSYLFDAQNFWHYTIFCGACSRVLARRFRFKLAGEAFVAGLMHDLGILIIVQHFTHEYREISKLVDSGKFNLIRAESVVLGSTHADIGGWLAEHWSLPNQLVEAVSYHHSTKKDLKSEGVKISETGATLTKIVALSEWFAKDMSYMDWYKTQNRNTLFAGPEDLHSLGDNEFIESASQITLLKQDIISEYNKSSEFTTGFDLGRNLY